MDNNGPGRLAAVREARKRRRKGKKRERNEEGKCDKSIKNRKNKVNAIALRSGRVSRGRVQSQYQQQDKRKSPIPDAMQIETLNNGEDRHQTECRR